MTMDRVLKILLLFLKFYFFLNNFLSSKFPETVSLTSSYLLLWYRRKKNFIKEVRWVILTAESQIL